LRIDAARRRLVAKSLVGIVLEILDTLALVRALAFLECDERTHRLSDDLCPSFVGLVVGLDFNRTFAAKVFVLHFAELWGYYGRLMLVIYCDIFCVSSL